MIGPGRPFLPIARALKDTLEARGILRWNADDLIHQSIIIHGGSVPAMVEMSGEASQPCPVRPIIFEDPVDAAFGLPSLGSLVEAWIEAYEQRIWLWDAERLTWSVDLEAARHDQGAIGRAGLSLL